MKGIILAGGTGSRLWPMTKVTSKQLLPVYDKPMIYYPLSTLMLAGVQEILIITTPHDLTSFKELLGDGSRFGIHLQYEVQPKPEGLAQAFLIGEKFLESESCLMILGDNIFHGVGLGTQLRNSMADSSAHIFTYEVKNPSQYGILKLNPNGTPETIIEKPAKPESNLAITGLYFFDNRVSEFARKVTPSERGELEITSLLNIYLREGSLTFTNLSRGVAWLDTGTNKDLHDAGSYIRIIEERTSLKIGALEEIAFRNGWISKLDLSKIAKDLSKSEYGQYLEGLI
jgi:glucose-1-phosphate thymidylyltransferase